MGAGWTNYADRLQGVWGAAILSARTANRLFSSKLCSFHLATTYGHCLSPNSSYLLLRNWKQNTRVINPRQSCSLQHPRVKQQHWKDPRSWSMEHTQTNPWQSHPKITGVCTLIINNITVGQLMDSGHSAEWEAQVNSYCKIQIIYLFISTTTFSSSFLLWSLEFPVLTLSIKAP